jgi:GNAT superfamily N-acetyltransferase
MEIRQLTIADAQYFEDALELLNRTQGRDLFNPTYMSRRISDPLSYVVGAFRDNQILAVGVAQVLHSVEFYLVFDAEIVNVLQNKVVGSFSTLCVHESLRGQGIGQKISQMRLDWLKDRGCEVVLGISWVSGLAHTSNRVFEKLNFKAVKRVENFFYQSSIDSPFVCPGCGGPPCTCPAILYRLEISEQT